MCGHCKIFLPNNQRYSQTPHCVYCLAKPVFKVIVDEAKNWEWPHLLQCIRDSSLNSNQETQGIFPLRSKQSRDFYVLKMMVVFYLLCQNSKSKACFA